MYFPDGAATPVIRARRYGNGSFEVIAGTRRSPAYADPCLSQVGDVAVDRAGVVLLCGAPGFSLWTFEPSGGGAVMPHHVACGVGGGDAGVAGAFVLGAAGCEFAVSGANGAVNVYEVSRFGAPDIASL